MYCPSTPRWGYVGWESGFELVNCLLTPPRKRPYKPFPLYISNTEHGAKSQLMLGSAIYFQYSFVAVNQYLHGAVTTNNTKWKQAVNTKWKQAGHKEWKCIKQFCPFEVLHMSTPHTSNSPVQRSVLHKNSDTSYYICGIQSTAQWFLCSQHTVDGKRHNSKLLWLTCGCRLLLLVSLPSLGFSCLACTPLLIFGNSIQVVKPGPYLLRME